MEVDESMVRNRHGCMHGWRTAALVHGGEVHSKRCLYIP